MFRITRIAGAVLVALGLNAPLCVQWSYLLDGTETGATTVDITEPYLEADRDRRDRRQADSGVFEAVLVSCATYSSG